MIICGIDASTSCTGWSIFKDDKLITYGAIKPHGEDWRGRVMDLTMALSEIFKIHRPNIIYIEETYTARNPQTTKVLTRLQGIVYAWCMNNECEFNTIRPSEWRKWLNFTQNKNVKREQLKKQSLQYVLDNYGLEVTDDESDAICIADAVVKMFIEGN